MSTDGGETWKSALERAAFDFKCDKKEIQLTEFSLTEAGAEGCGQSAVYIFAEGHWLRNDG